MRAAFSAFLLFFLLNHPLPGAAAPPPGTTHQRFLPIYVAKGFVLQQKKWNLLVGGGDHVTLSKVQQ